MRKSEELLRQACSTHATDGHASLFLLLLLLLVLYHMDLIGQKPASWDLQQSPVREEEGVQKGLLEPHPLSLGSPLLLLLLLYAHTHTHMQAPLEED